LTNGFYLKVELYMNGQRISRPVHRLVGEAFLGPLPDGLQTRHLNGNGHDNRVANLKYGTHLENMRDSIEHGTHVSLRMKARTHCSAGHEYTPENTARDRNGSRLCRKCDIAKAMAFQQRELLRREAAGEITPHLVREWALSQGLVETGVGRLSEDIRAAYAEAHPESQWTPEPAVRTAPPRRRGPRKPAMHGTDGMYTNHSCRCDDCRVAHTTALRERRHRVRALKQQTARHQRAA